MAARTSQRTQIVTFLKKHVIGKSVIAPPDTSSLDGGKIVATHEEDAIYSNLNQSSNGFCFDIITLARGTRYISGKQLLAEGTMNAVRVIRYEMTERMSTGDVIGHARFVASSNEEPDPFGGTIFFVQMKIDGDVLQVNESHVGYADVMSADGTFKPVATDGQYTYQAEGGKLVVKYQQQTYYVDPKTMKRTPTKEKFPVQVSKEITFPNPLPATVN